MGATPAVDPPMFGVDFGAEPGRRSTAAGLATCRAHLAQLRWPEGFVCPSCAGVSAWRTESGLFVCARCRRRTSVTSGTVFHRSRVPLDVWFAAAWLMTERPDGVSALQLQQELALGSYETAWSLLHRLRRVMALESWPKLRGEVELGAIAVDVVERGGTSFENGSMTVILAARRPTRAAPDDVRVAAVPDLSTLQVADFITRSIDPGAVLLPTLSFAQHRAEVRATRSRFLRAGPREAVESHGLADLAQRLERWLVGTLHHGVSAGHLPYYLDEFVFRVNRPAPRTPGGRYGRLLGLAAQADPAPFRDLVGGTTDAFEW